MPLHDPAMKSASRRGLSISLWFSEPISGHIALKYECESSGGLRLRGEHPLEEIVRPCHPVPCSGNCQPYLPLSLFTDAKWVLFDVRNRAGGARGRPCGAHQSRRRSSEASPCSGAMAAEEEAVGQEWEAFGENDFPALMETLLLPSKTDGKTPPTPVPCQLTVPEPPFFHAVGFTVFTGVFKPLEEVVGVMDQRVRAASDELERLVSARCARGRGTRTRTTLELELPCGHMSLSVK